MKKERKKKTEKESEEVYGQDKKRITEQNNFSFCKI